MKLILTTVIIALSLAPTQGSKRKTAGQDVVRPRYEVAAIKDKISIDGKLSEKAWAKANRVTLMFPWENQIGIKQKTTVKLLRDSNYLYVGYDCEDEDITATHENRDDPTYKDDCVEFFIRPNESSKQYFGLEMNARGVLFDYLYDFPKNNDKQFNLEGVLLKTTLRGTLNQSNDHDQGWSLELAIPWQSLQQLAAKVPPAKNEQWRVQLNRWDGTEAKGRRLSMWCSSGLSQPSPHNPERFGILVFQ